MKLLFFIDALMAGGAQRQMFNLALELKKHNCDITFLTYRQDNFYGKLLNENGINEINIPEKGRYIKRLLKCRKIIRQGNYDGVLAFLEGPCFIAEAAGFPFRKWKLVVGERSANPQILSSLKQKLYRILHPFADSVVSNSHCNIDMVLKANPFLKKKKCSVIYNLYDINQFEYNPFFKYKSREKFIITVASNFRYWKNLDGLIEGVNLLSEEEKEKLSIHWYGHEFDIDDSKQRGLEKIKQYGLENVFNLYKPTMEILPIMANSDAVGLFSHFEGLSNTICEAMALGKPIITTRVSDNHLFIKDRETGFLCDSKNPADIKNALSDLLSTSPDNLSKMGEKNRLFFEHFFDKEKIVASYLDLFKEK